MKVSAPQSAGVDRDLKAIAGPGIVVESNLVGCVLHIVVADSAEGATFVRIVPDVVERFVGRESITQGARADPQREDDACGHFDTSGDDEAEGGNEE